MKRVERRGAMEASASQQLVGHHRASFSQTPQHPTPPFSHTPNPRHVAHHETDPHAGRTARAAAASRQDTLIVDPRGSPRDGGYAHAQQSHRKPSPYFHPLRISHCTSLSPTLSLFSVPSRPLACVFLICSARVGQTRRPSTLLTRLWRRH